MNALPLISTFSDLGITATINGPDLTLDAPNGVLTTKLVCCLREDKQDVITWLGKLRNVLGEDWQEFASDPAQLKAAADSLMTQISRKRSVTPAHYTATVHCETYNQDVPHFPVNANTVRACVWCINGLTAPPIPSR